MPGRYDRGPLSERFQFEQIVQDFEGRRVSQLIYRDRFRWHGPWSPEDANWFFGGALASASLFIAGPLPEALPESDPASAAISLSARFRRELPSVVRPSDSRHRGPRANGSRPGSSMDRRARCTPVAARLEWAFSQPLVLNLPVTIAGLPTNFKNRAGVRT